jgi:hypothetical protein
VYKAGISILGDSQGELEKPELEVIEELIFRVNL